MPDPNPVEPTADLSRPGRDDTASGDHTRPAAPRTAAAPDDHTFLDPPREVDEIGRLGKYRVLGEIGRGGMGAVFRAEDTVLRRLVALKVMLPRHAAHPLARARFLREARAQARVEHDHVVAVFDVTDAGDTPFLAMPLLKGMTLSAALRANPRPPARAVVRVGREVAEGLAAAHEYGLVHRDIKPANVWLEGARSRVKILDFGLARAAEADAAGTDDEPLTAEGGVVGTPQYMSPEQARGEPVDARTDLWSLGVVLYQMATGTLPFTGSSTAAVLLSVVSHHPTGLAAAALPPALNRLITRLLAKDPAARPESAAEVAAELEQIETGLSAAVGVQVVALDAIPGAAPNPWEAIDTTEAGTDVGGPSLHAALARPTPPGRAKLQLAAGVLGLLLLAGLSWGLVRAMTAKPPAVAKADDPKPPPRPPAPPKPKDPPAADPTLPGVTAADVLTSPDWEWTEPENLGPEVNGQASEWDPAVSGDGLRLVFASGRDGKTSLYEARRGSIDGAFTDARRLDELTDGMLGVGGAFLSADGLTLLYWTDRPGKRGLRDLWTSRRADRAAPWGKPEAVVPGPAADGVERSPALSPDGLSLYFSSWDAVNTSDLYVARRASPAALWGPREPLGPGLNTAAHEDVPRPLADGRGFVFTRRDGGGPAQWLHAAPKPGGGWDLKPILSGPGYRNPTFTADGRAVVFHTILPGGKGGSDLWQMRRVPKTKAAALSAADVLTSPDWEWAEPENLGPEVNGDADEYDPALTADGLRLVYQSHRDAPSYLYEARRKTTAEAFGDRRRLDALGGGSKTGQPFLTADGLHLVFSSDRPGGAGARDLWESRRADRDAPWGGPTNLGPDVNNAWDQMWPALSPDGLTLYYAAWADDEKRFDLRVVRRAAAGGEWGKPEWLGPDVNTADVEIAPRPLADGRGFVFARSKGGGPAEWLLAAPKPGDGWDVKPVRPGHRDYAPTFTGDGRTVVFLSARPGGHGKNDLWQMRRVPKAKPNAAADAHRRVAEWVLKLPGTNAVYAGGANRHHAISELPTTPFVVTQIFLAAVPNPAAVDLAPLRDLGTLPMLAVSECDFGDDDFRKLVPTLNALGVRELALNSLPITDKTVELLRTIPSLELAMLQGNPKLGPQAYLPLADVPNLTGLYVTGALSDDVVTKLVASGRFENLIFGSGDLTPAVLPAVLKNRGLKRLTLGHFPLGDADLIRLADLPGLRSLDVIKTAVTAAGVKKLAAALPMCKIVWDGGTIEPTGK